MNSSAEFTIKYEVEMHLYEKKGKYFSLGKNLIFILLMTLIIFNVLVSCDVYEETGARIYTVHGKVIDVAKAPVPEAVIRVEGTDIKTVTDSNGEFTLNNVPGRTVRIYAEKDGLFSVPYFSGDNMVSNGSYINVEHSARARSIDGCNFLLVKNITIPMIQGTGDVSPLNGVEVTDVIGVVTQVCFEQAHNNSDFKTPDPSHGAPVPQVISNDGFYMQLLPNTSYDRLRADGDSSTSDGIFVSTRNPKGKIATSSWLDSCKINGGYPQPGDIVLVSGVVDESIKPDRFGESKGLKSRTQINATSVSRDNSIVPAGFIEFSSDNLLKLTYTVPEGVSSLDSFRIIPFDDNDGDNALARASKVYESCEGMLVEIDNPIVVGACYYNSTPIMADGGKKDGKYSQQFNTKWMAPVVQEDDYNTEVIIAYYDDLGGYKALPQIGTVLTDDTGAKVLRGVVDYNDNGFYMIYPLRKGNLKQSSYTPGFVDYKHLDFSRHDQFLFELNDEAPENSLYMMGDKKQQDWIKLEMTPSQEKYKLWKSGNTKWKNNTVATDSYEAFTVPWSTPKDSMDPNLNVAVFNLENYVAEGAKYRKYNDVANIIINNLQLPDLIYVVEMGDQDNSNDTIPYRNSSYSQNNLTGVVAARLNYETLINRIKKVTDIQYDYRQIDPVEFSQAGSPGNNIRVGFMFRTDRIQAYDIGLPTVHMEGLPGSSYRIPDNLKDDHTSLIFSSNGIENESTSIEPGYRKSEPSLTLDTKAKLADTSTEVLIEGYDENGKPILTLSQSPGFLQDSRFYNSRLPLVCKFKFIPTGEDFFGIALHLYSKGRDDQLYGSVQPPVLTSEIRRASQSVAVNDFINEILALDEDARIIVAGDVNDFGFTYPIKKLTGEPTESGFGGRQVLYSMSASYMPENERFTYTFNGNLQQLDHIFVSPAIYRNMGCPTPLSRDTDPTDDVVNAEWKNHVFVPHVDSLFSRDRHIQVSDHDPIAARIIL